MPHECVGPAGAMDRRQGAVSMVIRIFTCQNCGHKMRMSGHSCGSCNETKKPYQRLYFYVVPAVLLLIGLPGFLAL